jgi:uncharacterized membrane protein
MSFPTRISNFHWLGLLVILAVAASVRFVNLSRNSLWMDEFLSMECSSGWARTDLALAGQSTVAPDLISLHNARPWQTIWTSIGSDENHPPIYFILLRFWRVVFGDSPAAIRSLSVIAALAAIALLFAVGVNLHSPGAGLWACLLMALASPQVQQSQDARAYMLVTTACLAAVLALIRIDRLGPTPLRCAALFLAALIAPLMHYMAFASLAAMMIYAIFLMRGSSRKWTVISLLACLGTFAALWAPQVVQQHYRMLDDTQWLVDPPGAHAWLVLQHFCSLPARLFLDLDVVDSRVALFSVAAFALPILLCIRYRQVYLCWIWLMVPVLVALLIDICTGRSSLSMVRYTLAAGPGLYLILGMLAVTSPRMGWLPAAIIAISCAISLPSSYESRFPDYREVSRFIASSGSPTDPVIVANARPVAYLNESLLSISYYLEKQHHPIYLVSRAITPVMKNKLRGTRHFSIIADGSEALNLPIVPGLKLDRADLLVGMGLAGTEDPADHPIHYSPARHIADPSLRLALGL